MARKLSFPLKLLIIAAVILFALGILKDQIIKSMVTVAASRVVGAPVHIDGMSVAIIFNQSVRIKGFKLYNPEGFPKGVLLDIPQADIDYDLGAILKKDMHLPRLVLHLKEMTVIRNAQGALNVDALKVAQKDEGPSQPAMPLRIDVATLDLGKVIVQDYSKGEEPKTVTYDIGIHNKTFKNITSAQQLAALVMVQSLGATTLKNAAIYGAASLRDVARLPMGVAEAVLNVLKPHQ